MLFTFGNIYDGGISIHGALVLLLARNARLHIITQMTSQKDRGCVNSEEMRLLREC